MKFLLFSPPSELSDFSVKDENPIYPLGLAYLGAVLENEGHEVKVYNHFGDSWKLVFNQIKRTIIQEKPDVVGISSMTMNRTSAFKLSRLTKQIDPSIKVILGGVHPTTMYQQILENFPVDFIVLGEGEETIAELAKKLNSKNKKAFYSIKGIAFKDGEKIVNTGNRPSIMNLDKLPFPKHSYFKDKIERSNTAYILTSRGCPFGCLFCSTSNYWKRMRRERSVENVIQEIKEIKSNFPNVKHLFFVDDEFTLNQGRVIDFCKKFIEEQINLSWDCSTRVSSVSEELAGWMKKAGCVHVSLGVESGAPELIERINKRITNEQVFNALKIFYKWGIPTDIYLIVGIPGENSKTVSKTIDLLKKTAKFKPKFKKPAVLQIYPNTGLYELAKEQGIISDSYWLSNKLVPFYTYENSRNKMLYWSYKIAILNRYYQGELGEFIFRALTHPAKVFRLLKLGK